MANNVFQVKRTTVSGRTPNTTGSYATNSQYIAAGEFALNMADGILYSSNGSAVIEVGANNTNQRITNSLTINNARNLNFQTVNTSAAVYFTQQNDDNFVFYSTNTAYGARPVFGVFANSITSNLQIYIPLQLNSGVVANNSLGTAGQVLTTNSTGVYWSSVGGTGTVTSVATGNGMTGGPITTTGTVSLLANNGIIANSTGTFVNGNTGVVVNSTGVFVNATYIGTISANNASFLGGVAAASYVNTSGAYTISGVHDHTANLVVNAAILAGGNSGSAGQVLTSNGAGNVYWSTVSAGVNTAAQYTWTNNQTYSVGANAIILSNATQNWIWWNTTGVAAPSVTTRSAGTKLALYPSLSGSQVDYAIGIESNHLWFSTDNIVTGTKWYANTTNYMTANVGGLFHVGTVNGAALSTGTTFIANATQVTVSVPLSSNGGTGTAGQILASNGSAGSPYWTDAPVSNAVYMKGGAATIGTLAAGGSNIFRVNANTLNYNTTIATGENAQATGPLSVASGITLTVETGARVAIV